MTGVTLEVMRRTWEIPKRGHIAAIWNKKTMPGPKINFECPTSFRRLSYVQQKIPERDVSLSEFLDIGRCVIKDGALGTTQNQHI